MSSNDSRVSRVSQVNAEGQGCTTGDSPPDRGVLTLSLIRSNTPRARDPLSASLASRVGDQRVTTAVTAQQSWALRRRHPIPNEIASGSEHVADVDDAALVLIGKLRRDADMGALSEVHKDEPPATVVEGNYGAPLHPIGDARAGNAGLCVALEDQVAFGQVHVAAHAAECAA